MNPHEIAKRLNQELAGLGLTVWASGDEAWLSRDGADLALVRKTESGAWAVEANAIVSVEAPAGTAEATMKRMAADCLNQQVWPALASLGFKDNGEGDLWDPEEAMMLRWGIKETSSLAELVALLKKVGEGDFSEVVG